MTVPEPLEQPISPRPLIAHGRVWLRPMEERDLPAFMLLVNDTHVGARAGFGAPFGPDGAREWFTDKMKKMSDDRGAFFTVCEAGSGDLIGTVWLNHLSLWDRSAELAIAMDADHIGGGWGTEAQRAVLAHGFESIGLHRIFLTVDVENAAGDRQLPQGRLRRGGATARDLLPRRCVGRRPADVDPRGRVARAEGGGGGG